MCAGVKKDDSGNDQFNFLHGDNRFYTRFIPPECMNKQDNFFSGLLEGGALHTWLGRWIPAFSSG
jgi:hypothetical protein